MLSLQPELIKLVFVLVDLFVKSECNVLLLSQVVKVSVSGFHAYAQSDFVSGQFKVQRAAFTVQVTKISALASQVNV